MRLLLFIWVLIYSVFCYNITAKENSTDDSEFSKIKMRIDSLKNALSVCKSDSGKIELHYHLCREYSDIGQMDSAKKYGLNGISIGKYVHYPEGLARCHNNLGTVYWMQSDYQNAFDQFFITLSLWEENSDSPVKSRQQDAKRGIAETYGNIAGLYSVTSNNAKSLEYAIKCKNIMEELGNKPGLSIILGNIGIIYSQLSDYPMAIEFYLKSLKIEEELGNRNAVAYLLGSMAYIYKDIGELTKALDYALNSLKISEEFGDKQSISNQLGTLGNIYEKLHNFPKALEYHKRSLQLKEEMGNQNGIATTLSNIGNIYYNLPDSICDDFGIHSSEKLFSALGFYQKSLNIREKIGDKAGVAIANGNIGVIYLKQKRFISALEHTGKAQRIAFDIGDINIEKDFQHTFYRIYKETGNSGKALFHYEQHILLRDSIFKIDNQKEILRKQMKFDYEKKAAADSVKNAEEQKVKEARIRAQQAQIKQEQIQRYALYGGLALVVVFAGFIFNRFRVTRKQKKIIEEQKKIVEVKNEDILDSIHYAKRIQQALLPPDSYLKENLPEHFIFYKPKDIVSGDFYWISPNPSPSPLGEGSNTHSPLMGGAGGGLLFCIADCTGHGVPGAFMSLLGISFLNEIIKERNITSPGKALDVLRDEIIKNMNPDGREDIKDGMEIALYKFNFEEMPTSNPSQREGNAILSPYLGGAGGGLLEYASANIKLLLVRNGNLKELETDAMPVGVDFQASKPFNQHQIALETGDMLYTFSDGYADQFGGPPSASSRSDVMKGAGKRFKRGKLKELLLSISNKPVGAQKSILENTFNEWKGNLEQTDDVTVIGIKI